MTTYHPDTALESQTGTNARDDSADKQGFADTARDQFEKTQARARDTAEVARRQVSTSAQLATDHGTQFVRENPALAFAGAVGIGFLLGIAVRGR